MFIREEARRYNYAYLLESPWWIFVRDTDLIIESSFDLQKHFGEFGLSIRGYLPFLYSTLLSLRVKQRVDKPILDSTISKGILSRIMGCAAEQLFQTESISAALQANFQIFKNFQPETVSITVPSFYEICSSGATSNAEILRRALDLRRDPDCKWFRRKFYKLLSMFPNADENWQSALKEEMAIASERLRRHMQPRFRDLIVKGTIDGLVNAPLSLLLNIWPISIIVSGSQSIALSKLQLYLASKRFGWYSFLFRSLYLPPTQIGQSRGKSNG
jgi:hypothetical protein